MNLKEELPERGSNVIVKVKGNEYEAYLFHNDWVFIGNALDELNIKTMNDHYEYGKMITEWKYK